MHQWGTLEQFLYMIEQIFTKIFPIPNTLLKPQLPI